MKKILNSIFFVFIIIAVTVPSLSFADADVPTKIEAKKNPHEGEAFAAYVENDSKNLGGPGTDRDYSNGFKFSYIYAQDEAPKWSDRPTHFFRFIDDEIDIAKSNFSISFAQQIYTPSNTEVSALIQNDRPYAGWLYLAAGLSFKETDTAHYLELDAGMVGPSALGEQVQNSFHHLIQDDPANGWSNGLHDEFGIELSYEARYRYFNTRYFDFIPYYGLSLGNILTSGQVGGIVRVGYNLPNDFGPTRPSGGDGDSFISPVNPLKKPKPSFYLFAGAKANAVLRNIFLDGNTFRPSQHVTKYWFNSDTEVGFGLVILPIEIVWSYVVRSPEFEEQSNFNSFASVNLIYNL